MDLDLVLAEHLNFQKATLVDNENLLAEIKNSPLNFSGVQLTYDRGPTFFNLLQLQATSSITLISKATDKILALASFSWGPRWINGRKNVAMYVGDFRCENSRTLAKAWRLLYPELIQLFKSAPEFGPTTFLYTAVLQKNVRALNSLVKDKPGKTFFYKLFAEPKMVNVFFKKPFTAKTELKVKPGSAVSEDELRQFLSRIHSQMFLGSCFDYSPGNEWDRRKKMWPNFTLENFLVVTDSDNKIVACTLPWSPKDAKAMRLVSVSRLAAIGLSVAIFLGIKLPPLGETINILYLTHLTFETTVSLAERATLISSFIEFVLLHPKFSSYHFISFADFKNIHQFKPLKNFVMQTTNVNLYAVDLDNQPVFVPPDCDIEFEMGLV